MLLNYSAIHFFWQIYIAWYSIISIGFRAITMSFLSFLSQKAYPGECLRPDVVLSRSYLRKCSIWLGPPPIINLSFFENAIKSEPLGARGYYFLDIHISMIPTTGKIFKKIYEVRVTCPRWFKIELNNEDFSYLGNRCYKHCKKAFCLFP